MLSKNFCHRQDYQTFIGVGQLTFVLGLLLTRLSDNPSVFRYFERVISDSAMVYFLAGFLDGLAIVLIVLSIIFNLRGLTLYRTFR